MTATKKSTLPPHDDAEKGILEIVSVHNKPIVSSGDEKMIASRPPAFTVVLPKVDRPKFMQKHVNGWICWKIWFNTYRKFFTLIMALNLTGIVLTGTGLWPYARKYTGALVLGNLLFAILMRSELFLRFLYLMVNTLFAKWSPLRFRLGCTSTLQHLGGIHSGCATSAFLWLVFKVTDIFIDHADNHEATLVMGVITNLLIFVSVLSAFPWLRNNFHNVFERLHRFAGWLGLVSTWVFVILYDCFDPALGRWNTSWKRIVGDQQLWFTLGMTTLIAIPWLTIREVPVNIEFPSSKVAIIRFERGMQQGLLGRIGRSSVMEYHAFGIVSEGKHAKYHYMICGVQGDFTRKLGKEPPRTLWTRQLKFAGVSNTSTLYRRGIHVCTGTGLGSALSTCLQNPNWYLIWIGSDQEKTFGPTISGLIHRHMGSERLYLWDSKTRRGRPNIMKLVKDAYAYWQAEVIFVTSNYQGNLEVMEGCKEAGIPAFGTLWDF
ncbi:hypothetical protein K439DRAFT_1646325 [Ramaria rubella]|nr:hypothetical protein K439DRAFT_1646325 [Ramaria rubella]